MNDLHATALAFLDDPNAAFRAVPPELLADYLQGRPEKARKLIDSTEGIVRIAAQIRHWPAMRQAVRFLIACQQAVIDWWGNNVADGRLISQGSGKISRQEAEQTLGFSDSKVSRWRQALKEPERYEEFLIRQACRKAGLDTDTDDPSALRPTPGRDGPDFWPTPATLIDACVRYVLPELPPGIAIWEPACGDQRLANAIRNQGWQVYATDLYPQDDEPSVDFLDCIPPAELTFVVTNPPYNASDDFIERCTKLLDDRVIAGFALLLRHDHLQAGSRVDAFNRALLEVHCNWRPLWIEGSEGQPRWSFHWVIWGEGIRRPPHYLAGAAA